MITERAPRRTTDMPAHQAPRPGLDLVAIAVRHATVLRLAYFAIICTATLMRLGFDPDPERVLARLRRALDPQMNFKNVVDAVRNVALFAGWGVTWVLTARAPATRRDLAMATFLGMLASLTVESMQLFSASRETSVLDVLTNTLGSVVGAAGVWLIERRATTDMRSGTTLGVPGWMPASALLATAAGLAFAPSSRPSQVLGWAATPMLRMEAVAQQSPLVVPWLALLTDLGAWGLAGIAVAVSISDRTGRVRRAQLAVWLLIVPLLLAGAYYGRAMAGLQRESRSLPVQAVAVSLGLLLGLALVGRWRRRFPARSDRGLQLAVACAVVGALMSWVPAAWAVHPDGGPGFTWRQLVPLMSQFSRQDMSSVFLVLQKAGIGAALGACLAARKRAGAPQPGVRAAVLVAIVYEAGQLVVPGRFPDVTDIMITSAAAALAAVRVARASQAARQSPAELV
ncbi:MAG: VanZ family protein [Gemmatimonadaceae bacterium]|nr:VanZ family protein [Gemmatimonadaceae bacterium]